jgi:predicted transposase YdaD
MSDFESQLATQPHDAFFKAQFSKLDVARALFQSKLPPDLVPVIDWEELKLEPVSFVKSSLKQLHSDLIFSVPLTTGRLQLSLIFEHQTSVDPLMPFRFGDYQLEYLRQEIAKSSPPFGPTLCLVINQGPDSWNASTQFSDLYQVPIDLKSTLGQFVPTFDHLLIDLTQIDPTTENEPKLRIILTLMKLARLKDRILDFYHWLDAEWTLQLEDQLLRECLIYSLHIDQTIDFNAICDTIQNNRELSSKAMTIAQKLQEEGRQEGHQEGIAKGVWFGKIQTLQSLIQQPVSSTKTLQTLSEEQLKRQFQELETLYNAIHKL